MTAPTEQLPPTDVPPAYTAGRVAHELRQVAQDLGLHVHCAPAWRGVAGELLCPGTIRDGDAGLCLLTDLFEPAAVMVAWTGPEASEVLGGRHCEHATQMRRLLVDVFATALRGLGYDPVRSGRAWLVRSKDAR